MTPLVGLMFEAAKMRWLQGELIVTLLGRRIPFAFLEDIATKFEASYSPERAQSAIAYGLNEFSKTIQLQMGTFSSPSVDKIKQVQGEIDVVKDVMVSNIGMKGFLDEFLSTDS